jgi:hypothetical protein
LDRIHADIGDHEGAVRHEADAVGQMALGAFAKGVGCVA